VKGHEICYACSMHEEVGRLYNLDGKGERTKRMRTLKRMYNNNIMFVTGLD
jgi:hypothetical protein